jgi:hypothetical protein
LVALLVNTVLFCVLLWSTSLFQVAADGGGWALARNELAFELSPWPMYLTVLALALAVLAPSLLRRGSLTVPAWLVETPTGDPWPVSTIAALTTALLASLTSGAVAVGVIVAYRLSAGAASSDAANFDRFLAYQWVVAVGAAAAAGVLVLRDPDQGPAFALVGVPVAALTGSAGWFVFNLLLGGDFDLTVLWEMLRPATVTAWYLTLVSVPGAYAVAVWVSPAPVRRTALAVGTAGALSVLACGLALSQRDHLVAPEIVGSSVLDQPLDPQVEVISYVTDVVPRLTQDYQSIDRAAATLLSDPTLGPIGQADAIDQEVLPAVAAMVDDWQSYGAASDEVNHTHLAAVDALRTAEEKYRTLVEALRSSDSQALAQAQQLGAVEAEHWSQWLARRAAMAEGVGSG